LVRCTLKDILWFRSHISVSVFWDVIWGIVSCSFIEIDWRFRGLCHQGHLLPWWWMQYAPLKCQSTSASLRDATSPLMPRSRLSRSCISSPCHLAVAGQLYLSGVWSESHFASGVWFLWKNWLSLLLNFHLQFTI
jgi:hypothetical protein